MTDTAKALLDWLHRGYLSEAKTLRLRRVSSINPKPCGFCGLVTDVGVQFGWFEMTTTMAICPNCRDQLDVRLAPRMFGLSHRRVTIARMKKVVAEAEWMTAP